MTLPNPNRVPFTGVLTFIDQPSDGTVRGARGHRVILTRLAAAESLHELIGMGLCARLTLEGHDRERKIGTIMAATIDSSEIKVQGFVFGNDAPEFLERLRAEEGQFGMSYEITNSHIEDMRAEVWSITRCSFTGAAVLYKRKSAYRNTSFSLDGAR